MTIARDLSDLPAPTPERLAVPPDPPGPDNLAQLMADAWWQLYQESENFARDRAIPELPLRASSVGTRCDRALWYELAGIEPSDPPDAAASFRMHLGQMVHEEMRPAMEKIFGTLNGHDQNGDKHGWWLEDSLSLEGAGFPGSAHGDMVLWNHGQAQRVVEVKTQGGFGWKKTVANYGGGPTGPRWEHFLQGALVAVATAAPLVTVLYIALEPFSPKFASTRSVEPFEKFSGQWTQDTADWIGVVSRETSRQRRILRLVELEVMPERVLDHPDVPAGSFVVNPTRGTWNQLDPVTGQVLRSGEKWFCDYCRHRDQCLADGAESVQVELTKKAS